MEGSQERERLRFPQNLTRVTVTVPVPLWMARKAYKEGVSVKEGNVHRKQREKRCVSVDEEREIEPDASHTQCEILLIIFSDSNRLLPAVESHQTRALRLQQLSVSQKHRQPRVKSVRTASKAAFCQSVTQNRS